MKLKILILGSGGREHALAHKLSKSASVEKLYCCPGNPGIGQIAELVDIPLKHFHVIAEYCKKEAISLVVVGPEQPLADGIADELHKSGIVVFGPKKKAALLESSKAHSKEFMKKYNVPTSNYKTFTKDQRSEALEYISEHPLPIVLKADGLAAGKGVIIANNYDEAKENLNEIYDGLFGEAGDTIVIEDYLEGEEVSVLAISDGRNYVCLAPAQDHKRIYDNDMGKNTGGMGAYAPSPLIDNELKQQISEKIIRPVINGLASEGTPFVGCLYAGLMITKEKEAKVIEFNVRFGDPETQVVLSVFDGDLAKLLYSAAIGEIDHSAVKNIEKNFACCVILASEGYPDKYQKGFEIAGIKEAEAEGAVVYHSGTATQESKLVTSGGRVLGVTATGKTLAKAIDNTYNAVKNINFKKMYFRMDIGQKGLKHIK